MSTQHNTPLGLSVPPTVAVTVTDPTHPLYGLTLPCLGVTNKQRLGPACVIWLTPGVERLVPVAATSLSPIVRPTSRCRLAPASVAAFLRVLASAIDDTSARAGQEEHDGSDRDAAGALATATTPPPVGDAAGPRCDSAPDGARPAAALADAAAGGPAPGADGLPARVTGGGR